MGRARQRDQINKASSETHTNVMDPMNRKRSHARQPLRETSGNVPSPNKRHKGEAEPQSHPQIPELSRVNLNPDLSASQNQNHHPNGASNQGPVLALNGTITHGSNPHGTHANLSHTTLSGNKLARRVPPPAKDKPRLSRLVGDELQEWRTNWRKIMKTSVVYFDTQGIDLSNSAHQLEQKRAQRGLKHVGSTLVPFYDKDVTIIVSKRPYNPTYNYLVNDIFHDVTPLKIKVWNFDKVFRFLKNLGVNDFDNLSNNPTELTGGDLSNLLKEEKIFGSTDKDPNARREDLHYLDKNYLYVYDLSQNVRPIAVREWEGESIPTFHLTLDGKCPFLPESDNLERKRLRRLKKFEETQPYRNLLKKVADDLIANIKNRRVSLISLSSDASHASTDNDSTISQGFNEKHPTTEEKNSEEHTEEDKHTDENTDEHSDDDKENMEEEISFELKFKHPKPSLLRNSSGIPTNNSNSRYYDVAASGFNGTSNAVQLSIDSGNFVGNGLGPTISQVPSKNINNLKRRIFMKKQKQITEDKEKKDLKPGYCENCRIKYDHFEDHISSNRHRRFALDDSNFADIDDLIETINENKSLGLVTSDGDYSYAG